MDGISYSDYSEVAMASMASMAPLLLYKQMKMEMCVKSVSFKMKIPKKKVKKKKIYLNYGFSYL